jgi:hypothetical protein
MINKEIDYVYGLPTYRTKINPELYEKNKILSQIEKNYKVSKVRNEWSLDSFIKTDIHHCHNDEKNPKFKEINYYSLNKQYKKVITDFFNKLSLSGPMKFKYHIANYTCVRHSSVMTPHVHMDCTFSLIHYMSFDKKQHLPTIFRNPYLFGQFLPFQGKLQAMFSNQKENSWLYREWTMVGTEEDDIIIVPAILEHYVRNLDSKKSRITVVVNIDTND